MKKVLVLIIGVLAFIGCSKDEDVRVKQSFFVDVKEQYSQSKDAEYITKGNVFVFLFEDKGGDIDYKATTFGFSTNPRLTYADGTEVKYKEMENGSVVTFEDIPDGNYILWVYYEPGMLVYHSSMKLTVNEDTHLKRFTKVFKTDSDTNFGYQDWNIKW